MSEQSTTEAEVVMHIYLANDCAIGVKSKQKPAESHRVMYVIYEWGAGRFRMATFPEISPKKLCSKEFIYIGKLVNPPIL